MRKVVKLRGLHCKKVYANKVGIERNFSQWDFFFLWSVFVVETLECIAVGQLDMLLLGAPRLFPSDRRYPRGTMVIQ